MHSQSGLSPNFLKAVQYHRYHLSSTLNSFLQFLAVALLVVSVCRRLSVRNVLWLNGAS